MSNQHAVLPLPHYIQPSRLTCITSNTRALALPADPLRVISGRGTPGSLVLARVTTLGAYTEVEDLTGRQVRIRPDDLIVGVLGDRHSTTSLFGGIPPEGIALPEQGPLDLLAVGGIIGHCEAWPAYLGSPTKVQVLGLVTGQEGPLTTRRALCTSDQLELSCPVLVVAGTAAEVGKTTAAANLVHFLARRLGRRVAATKLSGTGRLRDLLVMRDAGAAPALDFVDRGLPTTYGPLGASMVAVAKGILNCLGTSHPDVVVAELGGDILGAHVPVFLADTEIQTAIRALVLIPSDGLAAHGALSVLAQTGFPAPAYLGQPWTRNAAASRVRAELLHHRPQINFSDEHELETFVDEVLGWRRPAPDYREDPVAVIDYRAAS